MKNPVVFEVITISLEKTRYTDYEATENSHDKERHFNIQWSMKCS